MRISYHCDKINKSSPKLNLNNQNYDNFNTLKT